MVPLTVPPYMGGGGRGDSIGAVGGNVGETVRGTAGGTVVGLPVPKV